MAEETTSDTMHGEVSVGDHSHAAVAQDNDAEVQAAGQQLSGLTLVPAAVYRFEIAYHWDRIYSHNFTLKDKYVFDYHNESSQKMVHVLQVCKQYRKQTEYIELNDRQQERAIAELCEVLDASQLLQSDKLPSFTFLDSRIFIVCPSAEVLVNSFELLKEKDSILCYSMKFVSRGLPFKPMFWSIGKLFTDPDEARLMKDLNDYLSANEDALGKTRAAWRENFTPYPALMVRGLLLANCFSLQRLERCANQRPHPPSFVE